MHTHLLEGIEALPNDADIAAFVEQEDDEFGGGMDHAHIGILNSAGKLYRIITTESGGETVRLSIRLNNFGLVSLNSAPGSPSTITRDGMRLDDVFSPPGAVNVA